MSTLTKAAKTTSHGGGKAADSVDDNGRLCTAAWPCSGGPGGDAEKKSTAEDAQNQDVHSFLSQTRQHDEVVGESEMGGRPLKNTTGCWWAKRVKLLDNTRGVLRLPGQILRPGFDDSGWYVKEGRNGVKPLTWKQAQRWMRHGELPSASDKDRQKEFLSAA